MKQVAILIPFLCLVIPIRAQVKNATNSVQDGGSDVNEDAWKHGFGECVHGVRTMYYFKDSEQTCSAADNQVLGKRK